MNVDDDAEYLAGSIAEYGTRALMNALKQNFPDTFMQFLIEMQDVTDEELRN